MFQHAEYYPMYMRESPRNRIRRAHEVVASKAQETAERQGRRASQEYEKFVGRMALLRRSSIPRYEIELLKSVSGFARWTKKDTITLTEYTAGEASISRHKQEEFYVDGVQSGWYLENINPERAYDPDDKSVAPSRSLVIAEDGTTWRGGWAAFGAENVIGVRAGTEENIYPFAAIGRFMRHHGVDVPE